MTEEQKWGGESTLFIKVIHEHAEEFTNFLQRMGPAVNRGLIRS